MTTVALNSVLTEVTPATRRGLVSIERARAELQVPDRSKDALLADWIVEETTTIEGELGYPLALATVCEAFSIEGFRLDCLILQRRPVQSVASVIEDGAELSNADYELDATSALLYRRCGGIRRRWHACSVEATYAAGFSLPTNAPGWATKACLLLLKHRWSAKDRDPMLRSQSIPGVIDKQFWVGSTGENAALPPEVEDLISPYREIRLP